jgi:hypothetical protein
MAKASRSKKHGVGTIHERKSATRGRERAEVRLQAKLAGNRAIAAAHQRPSGKERTFEMVPQPKLKRFVIRRR